MNICLNQKYFVKFITFSRTIQTTSFISMPKKKNKDVAVQAAAITSTGPVSSGKSGIEIKILAKPGAKHNSITDIEEAVGVQIAAPPVDGEANTELLKYLSKVLQLRKSQLTLEKGSKSRNKTVVVSGGNREDILQKLQEEKCKP